MKTATYHLRDGGTQTLEYDENAPCQICGQPVLEASMGGTAICPWCDMGVCRYCGVSACIVGEHVDGGASLKRWREHVARCKPSSLEIESGEK